MTPTTAALCVSAAKGIGSPKRECPPCASCAKVHTCDFDVGQNLSPGEDFYAATLDTHCGEVKVGAMICYDREFPESARILVPNGCPI